jgi:hypothetical protein
MYQAIIKSKTKTNLKALSRHGIDFKGNSAIYDKKDFMFRVVQLYLIKIRRD